ncbi:MAG: hypothetical protein FJZ01_11335 [Candidatus Sericytochromatia bacterium]|nr:hypothetical protein [Candidatus Tanganyikabacteria bacterium]
MSLLRLGCGLAIAAGLAACAAPVVVVPLPEADPRAGMAPDDAGDPARHHDYTLRTAAGESEFVWIPRFTAYQLLRRNGDLPLGAWVKDPPAGSEGREFARERFGGFYVGKYEASRATDGSVLVRQGAEPWAMVEWDEARRVSDALLPGRSHLLRGDEWTALAVWSAIHAVDVRGNTKYGADGLDPATTFDKVGTSGVARTGSARNAAWRPDQDASSHTGGPDGVFDLVGNLREWESAVTMIGHEFRIDGVPTGIGGTAPGYVASLHTSPELRRFGVVAGTTAQPAVAWFGLDAYHVAGYAAPGGGHAGTGGGDGAREYRTNRGGTYIDGHSGEVAQAGMWLLCVNREVGYKGEDQGFRPALRF